MPIARIRELQPGIVINPRFHRSGGYDFVTLEKDLPVDFRLENDQWGELCSHWHSSWSWEGKPFEPFAEVVTTLARCRHAGINNLLDIGPLASGNLPPTAFPELEEMAVWMKINSEAIYGTRALPAGEKASVLASAKGTVRYLYLNTVGKSKPQAIHHLRSVKANSCEIFPGSSPLIHLFRNWLYHEIRRHPRIPAHSIRCGDARG